MITKINIIVNKRIWEFQLEIPRFDFIKKYIIIKLEIKTIK